MEMSLITSFGFLSNVTRIHFIMKPHKTAELHAFACVCPYALSFPS